MRSQLRLQERNGVDSAGDTETGRPPEPPPEPPEPEEGGAPAPQPEPEPEPEPEQDENLLPWDAFNTHAEIDDWATTQGFSRAEDWGRMNLTAKRKWLVDYFDGARPWETAQE